MESSHLFSLNETLRRCVPNKDWFLFHRLSSFFYFCQHVTAVINMASIIKKKHKWLGTTKTVFNLQRILPTSSLKKIFEKQVSILLLVIVLQCICILCCFQHSSSREIGLRCVSSCIQSSVSASDHSAWGNLCPLNQGSAARLACFSSRQHVLGITLSFRFQKCFILNTGLSPPSPCWSSHAVWMCPHEITFFFQSFTICSFFE